MNDATVGPNDYDVVADIYDAYVQTDFDLALFEGEAAKSPGPILELMAGTGRVTATLLGSGRSVVAVDRSLAMLRHSSRRFRGAPHAARCICADVCRLPLATGFGLAVVPFNAFAEIVDPGDRGRMLADIERVLVPDGRCILTLHNPAIRAGGIPNSARTLGPFPLPDDLHLRITIEERLDDAARTVTAVQRFEAVNPDGDSRWRRTQVLRFALVDRIETEHAARAAGFAIAGLWGDYDRTPFDQRTSPYMIWTLTKSSGT